MLNLKFSTIKDISIQRCVLCVRCEYRVCRLGAGVCGCVCRCETKAQYERRNTNVL